MASIIGFDLCCSCGYNLRGLKTSARCPECNRPVSAALDLAEKCKVNLTQEQLESLKQGTLTLSALIICVAAVFLTAMLLFEGFRSPWVGHLFLFGCAAMSMTAAARLKGFTSRLFPSVAALALSCILILRAVLGTVGLMPAGGLPWPQLTAVMLAFAAALFLRELGCITGALNQSGHSRSCRQTALKVVALSVIAGTLSIFGLPTPFAASGLPFLANMVTLASTLWLLRIVRRDLKEAVPKSTFCFLSG